MVCTGVVAGAGLKITLARGILLHPLAPMTASDPALAAPGGADPALHGPRRLAVALVVATVVLIGFGAMVTSTGSGMAFADWPLSDGQLMPERSLTDLDAFLEHFHRIIATLVGAMMVALLIWITVRAPERPRLRRWAGLGLLLVIVQGIVGGAGVLKNLPLLTSATHGVLAQVTLATFSTIALALTPDWNTRTRAPAHLCRRSRRLCTVGLVALLVQLTLGAIARHSHQPHALWTHVGLAAVVFLLVLVAIGASGVHGDVPRVKALGRWLLSLLVVQIALGFVALMVRTGKHPENIDALWRSSLISAHVLIGALLMLCMAQLAARVFRATRASA